MKAFVIGFILGVSSATVGFSGLAPIFDDGVRTIQRTAINFTQKAQQQQLQNYDIKYPTSPQ